MKKRRDGTPMTVDDDFGGLCARSFSDCWAAYTGIRWRFFLALAEWWRSR